MAAVYPTPFQPGPRLIDGTDLNAALAMPLRSSQDNITAHAGGTQAAAYQLGPALNRVTVVATAGDSVRLPPSAAGRTVTVINADASDAMQVFGFGTDTINGAATATGISQPAGTTFVYNCTTKGNWVQNGAAAGTFSGTFDGVLGGNTPAAATVTTLNATGNATFGTYALRSVGNALTAVGTNRATALQLAKEINNVTTAGSGTGVILPTGVIGMRITVFSAGANAAQVYANGSETIDTVAGSTGVPLTNTKRCDYFFVAANTWISAQLGVVSA